MTNLLAHKTLQKYTISSDERSLNLYLKEINEFPLLSPEEELRLARSAQQGDKTALEELIKPNLRFVVYIAKQYQNRGMSISELISEGNVGLIKAAKKFDDRGFRLISLAVWPIRQAIEAGLAEMGRIVRLPINRVSTIYKMNKAGARLGQELGRNASIEEIAESLNLSPSEVLITSRIHSSHISLDASTDSGDDNTTARQLESPQLNPDQIISLGELHLVLEKTLDSLTPREAQIVEWYYGLHNNQPLTLEEIGQRFNPTLTRERIRQILKKAVGRLKHPSRKRALLPFFEKIESL